MKNVVSTKLYYIDYNYIKENYLDKKLWKKTWVLYDHGPLTVSMELRSIDVHNDCIDLAVRVDYGGDARHKYSPHSDYNYACIPMDNEEYTNVLFQNKIYGVALRTLQAIESRVIDELAVYKAEEERVASLRQKLEDVATKFLDDNKIEDKAFRKAYIDTFVDQNTYSYFCEIEEQFKNHILTKEMLLWASFNNKKEDFDAFQKILNGKRVSKSTIKVWLRKQEDEKHDFVKLLPKINLGVSE